MCTLPSIATGLVSTASDDDDDLTRRLINMRYERDDIVTAIESMNTDSTDVETYLGSSPATTTQHRRRYDDVNDDDDQGARRRSIVTALESMSTDSTGVVTRYLGSPPATTAQHRRRNGDENDDDDQGARRRSIVTALESMNTDSTGVATRYLGSVPAPATTAQHRRDHDDDEGDRDAGRLFTFSNENSWGRIVAGYARNEEHKEADDHDDGDDDEEELSRGRFQGSFRGGDLVNDENNNDNENNDRNNNNGNNNNNNNNHDNNSSLHGLRLFMDGLFTSKTGGFTSTTSTSTSTTALPVHNSGGSRPLSSIFTRSGSASEGEGERMGTSPVAASASVDRAASGNGGRNEVATADEFPSRTNQTATSDSKAASRRTELTKWFKEPVFVKAVPWLSRGVFCFCGSLILAASVATVIFLMINT